MFDSKNLVERIDDTIYGKPFIKEGLGIYYEVISEIISDYTGHMLYFEGRISTISKKILTELAQLFNIGTTDRNSQIFYKVLQYISLNYMNDITNESIANEFYYHPYYLSDLVKQNTGMTLHRYIMNCRIEKALRLILSSGLSFEEIASETGFKTQSHFTICFKRITGKLPSNYRVHTL